MVRKKKLNWDSTSSGTEFELLEVINYNVKITASGNSGLSDESHIQWEDCHPTL